MRHSQGINFAVELLLGGALFKSVGITNIKAREICVLVEYILLRR